MAERGLRILLRFTRFSPVVLLLIGATSLVFAHGDESRWETLKHYASPFEHTWERWLYSITSTALISAAPFLILFFIPLKNATEHSSLLKVLLSFASGGLLGDAFLHLIPHAVTPHDHSHSHEDHHDDHHEDHVHQGDTHHEHGHTHDHMEEMIVGLWVLGGIVTFLMVEKFVRLAKGGHSHGHSHKPTSHATDEAVAVKKSDNDVSTVRKRKGQKEQQSSASQVEEKQPQTEIKVAGYLNLAADFAHNFTDGLAIGASYLVGKNVGFVTTFTILLHEVPHEIGDFAILIQSGCPRKKAMYLQLVTAVGAIAGTICGMLAGGAGTEATSWILPFTAGGFIYIATVSVIPELLENSTPLQSIMEILAVFVGIGMMVLIVYFE